MSKPLPQSLSAGLEVGLGEKFAAIQEPWTIYRLEDGTVIRMRIMLSKVVKTGKKLPNGRDELSLSMQQICDIDYVERLGNKDEAS